MAKASLSRLQLLEIGTSDIAVTGVLPFLSGFSNGLLAASPLAPLVYFASMVVVPCFNHSSFFMTWAYPDFKIKFKDHPLSFSIFFNFVFRRVRKIRLSEFSSR